MKGGDGWLVTISLTGLRCLKGLVIDFFLCSSSLQMGRGGGARYRLQLRKMFYFNIFHLLDPCGRYGRFLCVTNRSNRPVTLLVDHFGPIRDTIKSTVAATVIEK